MIFRFDAFALDTEGYVLNKGTEPVSVEPQAFRLLQFLVQNRDRVVGKDEMIDHVWEGRIISDAAITSAINLVRRAVGDNGKTQAIIKTFPRRGFRFVGDVTEEGDGVTMPSPIPALGKPSIAVLPFDNLSGDLDVEFFADGITEDIITEISKFRWFFVIARTSSFSYKGQSLDIRRIAEELGVRYVLEGSVRRVGNQVRITAQLVDGGTGNHLWAERYDRELNDVFAVQDEITQAIAGAVAPSFALAEADRADRKAPANFDAWDHAMRGNWHLWRMSREDLAVAETYFNNALGLDPKSVVALSGLAVCSAWQVTFGWTDNLEATASKGFQAAGRAVELDDQDAWSHAALGFVNFLTRGHEEARSACRRAADLNPSLAMAEGVLGSICAWAGDYGEATAHAEMARRLSPRDPAHGMWSLARTTAEYQAGNYETAVRCAKDMIEATPKYPAAWRYLAAGYANLDRLDDAKAAIDQLLKVLPNDSLELAQTLVPGADQARRQHYFDGLKKAGLPKV